MRKSYVDKKRLGWLGEGGGGWDEIMLAALLSNSPKSPRLKRLPYKFNNHFLIYKKKTDFTHCSVTEDVHNLIGRAEVDIRDTYPFKTFSGLICIISIKLKTMNLVNEVTTQITRHI